MTHFDVPLIFPFEIKTNFFLETCYLCVFYIFYNKYACFKICENYLLFLSGLYSFTKTDHNPQSAPQSAHTDFCDINLFTTCFAVIDLLSVPFFAF